MLKLTVEHVWNDISAQLKELLNDDTYDRWIAGIIPLNVDQRHLTLGVSNDVFSEWLSANYKGLIEDIFAKSTGTQVKVRFESGHEAPVVAMPELAKTTERSSSSTRGFRAAAPVADKRFNKHFTFESFVVGENCTFAHAASLATAESPGIAYNPLFLHGPTGLGKTHLMQAIAQHALSSGKCRHAEYLTSEEFANFYVEALRDKALPTFRRRFRNVDMLLIDDVQFFKGKEQFQEEFFHTFNSLYHAHKQIVISSDRPAHEIGGLEKRLVSRFEWGLTTEILPPAMETRLAILKKKQFEHTVKLSDDVLFFIANKIKSNVRRLEGALIRLVSYASITGAVIDLTLAENLLLPILEEEIGTSMTIESIQRSVAEYFDIRLADMTSKRRPANIAVPRQIAMYIARTLTDFSSPTIAEAFNRNHATVLHAVSAVTKKMSRDPSFRQTVNSLERRLVR
ncbi:MAG: chromosomal replication initiator protein DnaA [Lentisphaeria bacterium]|nr:chromosomal replication initiator protein DnaA [Lentisphaeria bacterium]